MSSCELLDKNMNSEWHFGVLNKKLAKVPQVPPIGIKQPAIHRKKLCVIVYGVSEWTTYAISVSYIFNLF